MLGTYDADGPFAFQRLILLENGRALTCPVAGDECTPRGLPAGDPRAAVSLRSYAIYPGGTAATGLRIVFGGLSTATPPLDEVVFSFALDERKDRATLSPASGGAPVAFTRQPCSKLMYREDDEESACAFYACKHDEKPCPYYSDFGLHYCKKYYRVDFKHPSFGPRTRQCLQEQLRDARTALLSCGPIQELALASHEKCYVDSGFCELGDRDRGRIIRELDVRDVTFGNALRYLSTKIECVGRP
jgi:hypothetical protein